MSFFDEIGRKVSDVGQKTVQKTKDISDTARINSQINTEENIIKQTYMEIGRKYVEIHSEDSEPELAEYVEMIKESEKKIARYKKIIQNLKGIRICPNCGEEVAREASFCNSCGSRIKEEYLNGDSAGEKRCVKCGSTIEDGMKFCTKCGTPVEKENEIDDVKVSLEKDFEENESSERKCKKCGTTLEKDAAFCVNCGEKIS